MKKKTGAYVHGPTDKNGITLKVVYYMQKNEFDNYNI